MRLVFDIETERLVNPEKLWIISVRDPDTDYRESFLNPLDNPEPFLELASRVSEWIGHNALAFDAPQVNRLFAREVIPLGSVTDTLIISRTLSYRLSGGHSLEAWGERFNYPKVKHEDFSWLSPELIERNVVDVEINTQLLEFFQKYIQSPDWQPAIWLEHQTAILCGIMHSHGFHFNYQEAKELYNELDRTVNDLDEAIRTQFKPKPRYVRTITPSLTQLGTLKLKDFRWLEKSEALSGTVKTASSASSDRRSGFNKLENKDLTPYGPDAPFSLIRWEEFNPGSTKQIVERLNAAGWKPTEKTAKHIEAERNRDKEKLEYFRTYGWKCNEQNLKTLPDTAPRSAQKLTQRLILANRRSTLEEWFAAYNKDTGRIHGTFNHIGSWTHRMSHTRPNQANIPSEARYRSLWCCPEDRLLVGVDAEGIQLRVLAHYMDDPVFTEALVNGDKTKGTDAHSLNKEALGELCADRDVAKTFIYAFLLGAGTGKIAEILNCSRTEAEKAQQNFIEAYPGLKWLKSTKIPHDAKKGYFIGLDKRKVAHHMEHKMLAGYLQNGEAIIMKLAATIWYPQLLNDGIDIKVCDFVHDEWVTEVPNDLKTAEYVKQVQCEAIVEAGKRLETKCPMAGSGSIGLTWADIH